MQPQATVQPSHPMRTRAQNGIFKTKHPPSYAHLAHNALLSTLHSIKEPKGFKSASKSPEWVAAMDAELRALHSNHTWDLVPRPPNENIMGSKWVFHTKFLADGSVDR